VCHLVNWLQQGWKIGSALSANCYWFQWSGDQIGLWMSYHPEWPCFLGFMNSNISIILTSPPSCLVGVCCCRKSCLQLLRIKLKLRRQI
jgi:hypothetical protein